MDEGHDTTRTVRIIGVPPTSFVDLLAHLQDLLRELDLLSVTEGVDHAVPSELRDLTGTIARRYEAAWTAAWQQAAAAERAGRDRVDLELEFDASVGEAAEELLVLVEQADELSRSGLLLTRETPDDLARLRRWFAEEVHRQVRHEAEPEPYPF